MMILGSGLVLSDNIGDVEFDQLRAGLAELGAPVKLHQGIVIADRHFGGGENFGVFLADAPIEIRGLPAHLHEFALALGDGSFGPPEMKVSAKKPALVSKSSALKASS